MEPWSVLLLTVAVAGALVVWSTVAQTKQTSESMLNEYEELLVEARRAMREPMLQDDEDHIDSTTPFVS